MAATTPLSAMAANGVKLTLATDRKIYDDLKVEDSTGMEECGSDEEEDSSDEDDDRRSEATSDDKDGAPSAKQGKHDQGEEDEDNDDDEKDTKGEDDGDENSDTAMQRQSKRKPSKSRIKRILPQDLPPHSSLSPDAPFPYSGGLDATPKMNQSGGQMSMAASLSLNYLDKQRGQRRPSGDLTRGYQCNICGKEFRVPSRYESHMLSHSKGKPFCCDVCGKLFASQQKLDVHKPVHGRSRKDAFNCPTCGHQCTNWRAYLYHVAKHTSNGGKKHNCQVCGRQFHAAQRLRNHMQSHIDGKNFCCLICGKLFESKKRLDTHSIIHDTERREPFSCVDCGKVYDDWRAFKQHMKTHGSEGVIYRCEICSAQFYTQYEKEKHKRVHTSDKRYQCQHCHKCFRSQSMLSVHERKHSGEKGHECTVCGREFSRAFSLKQHMKMHAGEAEFMCHLCGKAFAHGEELTQHTAEHAGDREFVCDQCGKSFAVKSHHHRHLMVHAAGEPWKCGVCGKLFDTQPQLQSHMSVHRGSGQQNFACLACSEVFASQLELEAHAHTHGKSPPFVCGLCGKMFAEQRYFRQHMKRHTARAQKEKLQAQGVSSPAAATSGDADTKSSPGSLGHTCHMCGQNWGTRQELIAHIEDHKRSGLLMYFNLMDGQMRTTSQSQQKGKLANDASRQESGSDDDSETASDSEGSEETNGHKAGQPRGSASHGRQSSRSTRGQRSSSQGSSLTEIAERAMALRMQPPTVVSSYVNTSTNTSSVSPGHATPVKSEMAPRGNAVDIGGSAPSQDYYSPPIFPGQMPGVTNHATPYHAAAHAYQQSTPQGYMDVGGEMAQHGISPQKGLPGFADFRRQLGMYPAASSTSGGSYQGSYPDPVTSTPHFSVGGQMPGSSAFPGAYATPPVIPHPAVYMPEHSTPTMPPNHGLKMPVFPGMGGNEEAAVGGQPLPQSGSVPQFEPMLQFQPLSS